MEKLGSRSLRALGGFGNLQGLESWSAKDLEGFPKLGVPFWGSL